MDTVTLESRHAEGLAGGVAAAADIIAIGIDMMTATIERPELDHAAGKRLRSLVLEAQWLASEILSVAEALDEA